MKKYATFFALSFFLVMTAGCGGGSSSIPASGGGGNPTPTPTPIPTPTPTLVPENASILSFSRNVAYSGDVVTIMGTNFSDSPSDITVTFGDAIASVLSTSETSIEVQIPDVEDIITDMLVTMTGRIVSNIAETDFNRSIAVHPKKVGEWTVSTNSLFKGNRSTTTLKMVDDLTLYTPLETSKGSGGVIYRSTNGGVTWTQWAAKGFAQSYYPSTNGEGWAEWGGNIIGIPAEGTNRIDNILHSHDDNSNSGIVGFYVSDDLTKGVVVRYDRVVYTTDNGVDFTKIYDDSRGSIDIQSMFALDEHHVWAGGRNSNNKPFLLYCNGDNTVWNTIDIEGVESERPFVSALQFVDPLSGYVIIRGGGVFFMYHTIDGGSTWSDLELPFEKAESFVFKDENVGWLTVNNEIYKTLDGGLTWNIDFIHEEELTGDIIYSDGMVWTNSDSSMLKYFEE